MQWFRDLDFGLQAFIFSCVLALYFGLMMLAKKKDDEE
jgi:hypothetical protein